jgi:type IV secretory pathway TraG/TraD family ATPase VirD4
VRLSKLRSRDVSVTGAVQTPAQLEHLYGTAARGVLEGFATKIFFGGGLGQHDAKYASELAGTCTVASVAETRHRDLLRDRCVRPRFGDRPIDPLEGCPRQHIEEARRTV